MDENEWHPSWQYDAAELPAHWGDWVAEHRVAFQEAGVNADWIRARLDDPAHLPVADQEFMINLRVADHNNPDGAPFAQAGNHVMVYGAYASAAGMIHRLNLNRWAWLKIKKFLFTQRRFALRDGTNLKSGCLH